MSYTHLLHSYTSQQDKAALRNTVPFILTSFFVVYSVLLITNGYYFLIFLALGFSLGTFNSFNTHVDYKIPNYEKTHVSLVYEQQECSSTQVELFYAPLTKVVNQLLDYVMRDFVSSWWNPMNYHHDITFETIARTRLNLMFLNIQKILLNQERNDIVMSTLYGVANTLIIHMRECRSFEDSRLSIDEYVSQNPQSPFGQLFSREEQHRQLKGLSQTFLNRTLPATDKNSMLQMSLFTELLATYLFGSVLDSFSDPDYLNCWIIHLLSDKKTANVLTSAISDAVLMENDQSITDDTDDDSTSTTSSFEQVTSPDTPESMSLQSSAILTPISFTIIDISATPQSTLNKSDLVYLLQIEKPKDHAGSEGGGYVITRSYCDFETLHTILYARYKTQLKLPHTSSKSWLQQKKRISLNTISMGLQIYIDTVAKDEEMGVDPVVAAFLRKERHTDDGASFAEEFKDEAQSLKSSKSLFSKSQSDNTENNKWFALKSKTRNNSISSIQSKEIQNEPVQEEPIQYTKDMIKQDTQLYPKSLSTMDVELLIETTYALVVEIFNLTTANNKAWMRRSILNLLREIVRRSYVEFISEQYTDFVNAYMSPDAIVETLNNLGESFWPEGVWGEAKPARAEEDKLASRQLARDMLMTKLIPSAVRQLIGDQNCNLAMDRIWARIQDPNLNRVLIIQVMERIIKPILG